MEGSSKRRPNSGRGFDDRRLDVRVNELAIAQHAVAAVRQLVALGLSASAVRSRVACGRWHALHVGVIAIFPPRLLTRRGRIMGGVLACAPQTAASVRAAAELHELRLARRGWIDVTTPGAPGHRRPGIRLHSGMTLTPQDIATIDGIPCTTLARTLLDVADDATTRELERALDAAAQRRTLDATAIADVLGRCGAGRRGAPRLRAVLGDHVAGSTITRNDLEEAFLAIARAAGHPPDAVNAWIAWPQGGGAEGDFVWHQQRLVVEVDGRDPHTTRRAFEHDRHRDQQLALLGHRVIRFTWRQVLFEPRYVGATLCALLGASSSSR
jgi:hypothetical protein